MENKKLDTLKQHSNIVKKCKAVFIEKNKDYGTAWRVLRLPTLTDQVMIKAQRIKAIQTQKKQLVDDGVSIELIGIINYIIIALMQIDLKNDKRMYLPYEDLVMCYDKCVGQITDLLERKNHDYDEAWRKMRMSSIIDIILVKLLRIKHIERLDGKVILSESVLANYQDIINYAIFYLIRLGEEEQVKKDKTNLK